MYRNEKIMLFNWFTRGHGGNGEAVEILAAGELSTNRYYDVVKLALQLVLISLLKQSSTGTFFKVLPCHSITRCITLSEVISTVTGLFLKIIENDEPR